MDARTYWNKYAKAHGGPSGVAEKLGLPYSTIAGVCNGSRGIGHSLAVRMAAADPALDVARLVWVRPLKGSKQPRSKRVGAVRKKAA